MNVPLLNSFIDLLIAHQAKNVKNGAFQNCWRTARGAIIKLSCMKSLNCTFSDFRNLPTIWIDLMQRISKEDAIQMSSFAFTKLSIKEKSNVSFQMVFKKKSYCRVLKRYQYFYLNPEHYNRLSNKTSQLQNHHNRVPI